MRARIKKIYPEVEGLLKQMRSCIDQRKPDDALDVHAKLCQHFNRGGEMEPDHFDRMREMYSEAMQVKVEQEPELQTPIMES